MEFVISAPTMWRPPGWKFVDAQLMRSVIHAAGRVRAFESKNSMKPPLLSFLRASVSAAEAQMIGSAVAVTVSARAIARQATICKVRKTIDFVFIGFSFLHHIAQIRSGGYPSYLHSRR